MSQVRSALTLPPKSEYAVAAEALKWPKAELACSSNVPGGALVEALRDAVCVITSPRAGVADRAAKLAKTMDVAQRRQSDCFARVVQTCARPTRRVEQMRPNAPSDNSRALAGLGIS